MCDYWVVCHGFRVCVALPRGLSWIRWAVRTLPFLGKIKESGFLEDWDCWFINLCRTDPISAHLELLLRHFTNLAAYGAVSCLSELFSVEVC
jgi:hypothetical protein